MPAVKSPTSPTKPKTMTTVIDKKVTVQLPGKKKGEEREVLYPKYEARYYCCPDENGNEYLGPITVAKAKELIGWETEDEYAKRRLESDPTLKENKLKFGAEYTLKDAAGNKVKCHNNSTNRPFDFEHCKKLRQDILTKDWMMNHEDIIISRTGIVVSGQHRLIALILAYEEWKKQIKWQEVWADATSGEGKEPYIESLISFGSSDDPAVLKTFDNVKPRSLSDAFYVSPLFMGKSQGARNKMSEMMQRGIKLLWKRLNATGGGFIEKMTIPAACDFSDRHKRLLGAVKHIHDEMGEESGNIFQTMRLHSGCCAGLLFLMGQSGTPNNKIENYHSLGSPREESQLDWKRWDKALEFWSEMAKNPQAEKPEDLPPSWVMLVRDALVALDGESGRGGTMRERHSVIANAWTMFFNKESFDDIECEDLHPEMSVDPDTNRRKIIEEPLMGGADLGEQYDEEETEVSAPTPDQVKAEATKIREENNKAALEKAKPTVSANPDKKVLPISTLPKNGVKVSPPAKLPIAPLAVGPKNVNPITGRGPNNEMPKKPQTKPKPGLRGGVGGTENPPY